MRLEIRTLSRAISTLVVLFVLVFGASLDVAAQKGHHSHRGRDWGRSHNRGRHLGWERGRRVGQDGDRRRLRRAVRRERKAERKALRRQRRIERRSSWDDSRNWQRSRSDFRGRQFAQSRGGRGRH
ncbi:MAG TPA: hypothetical protein VF659_07910 [Pyrinomonadaceae bacterium]|jgi:hypothetical protein